MDSHSFFASLDKSPGHGPRGDCWLWTGWTRKGYGSLRIGRHVVYAHRYAFELTNGPVPDGQLVRHSCDTPLCCNPAHLQAGTAQQNSDDMKARGRSAKGTKNGNHTKPTRRTHGERNRHARLAESDIVEILAQAKPANEIAAEYGVSLRHAQRILAGESWGYLHDSRLR